MAGGSQRPIRAVKDLLFLAHRIPYPPDKGDKIRSFHELRHLSASFRIHLGAFVDDPEDWLHAERLNDYCASIHLLPLDRRTARLRSLAGFFTGQALTVPFYRDRRMSRWVQATVRDRHISAALVFSSAMAQYAAGLPIARCVLDCVDVDPQKWLQYAGTKRWPASWVYRREGRRLLAHDRAMAARFDRILFVSRKEADLFAGLAPESADRVTVLENGVDAGYFFAGGDYPDPYGGDGSTMVFTGAMDYWPNVEGVLWFVGEVFPSIRARCPGARLCIVGSRPHHSILALQGMPGIEVTGRVADVRPYLAHARLALAPLMIARGVQNKVLEAMAMGKLLLATPAALEGIELGPEIDVMIAEGAEEWIRLATDALSTAPLKVHSTANREFVLRRYDWGSNLRGLKGLLQEP